MKYLYALVGMLVLLAGSAAAGSFTAKMDVDTYVDEESANQTYADSELLWAASVDGTPSKIAYLSIINLFGSQSIFQPEQITSATLTLDAAEVEEAGKVTAYFLHGETLDTTTWYDRKEYDETVSSPAVEIEEAGSYTWDVTDIVKKAIETCTEGCPYSIVLVAEDGASVAFASSESSGSTPVLEYVTNE
ncbi:MAG TPA: DNRLRE domain-containing protein [Methanothrix sp.]|nr:DNRLRE domain-containing protein [Methanothrix sp.]HPT18526.1 DNRLRE domain-containing protein [Methanothrix sp.]